MRLKDLHQKDVVRRNGRAKYLMVQSQSRVRGRNWAKKMQILKICLEITN